MTRADILAGMTELLGDDEDLKNELYDDYLAESKRLCAEAEKAFLAEDCKQLRHCAHTLKGCSANVVLESIRLICYDWQIAAEKGDIARCRELFEEVKKSLAGLPA